MGRMTVTLDEELLAEAQKALGAPTKVAAIRLALAQALRWKRLTEALEHQGQIDLDLDRKKLAELRAT